MSNPDSGSQTKKARKPKPKNYYFDNDLVEELCAEYVHGGCVDVELRDEIMSHAEELIRQIIRTLNLHNLYPGKDSSSFGDLFQVAWAQIESALYKFDDSPGHTKIFNMWCVTPDTMLIGSDGICEIQDCVGNKPIGEILFDVHGIEGLNKATSYIRRSIGKTLKITTKQHYNIEVTPQHKIMVLNENGIGWVQASDLKNGDLLSIQFGQNCFGSNNKINFEPVNSRYRGWIPPLIWTKELAYLVGLAVSEGSISDRGLIICNTEPEIIRFLQNNTLGLNFRREGNVKNVCSSTRLVEFLKWLGMGTHAINKKIPSIMFGCSKEIIIEFLRGLFDGDGHSNIRTGQVGYTSVSVKLIEQLRVLLLNFGIITKTSIDYIKYSLLKNDNGLYISHNKHTTYQLLLSTIDSVRYYNDIGFNVHRKQQKFNCLKSSRGVVLPDRLMSWIHELVECAPISRTSVDKQTANSDHKHGLQVHNILKRKTGIAKKTLGLLLEAYELASDLKSYKLLEDRYNELSNTIWLPIIDISDSESKTIDIEVPNTRSYAANGIIVSNSQIAKTVMLAYIKKEFRDKKHSTKYKSHLTFKRRAKPSNLKLDRFILEAMEICKYSDEYIILLDTLQYVYEEDERPYEGLIGKLSEHSGMPRSKVTNFLKYLRLRNIEFSDAPSNEESINTGRITFIERPSLDDEDGY